jgi:hypothetical protein
MVVLKTNSKFLVKTWYQFVFVPIFLISNDDICRIRYISCQAFYFKNKTLFLMKYVSSVFTS